MPVFLIYNSGRTAAGIIELLVHGDAQLKMPHVIIGQMGTEVVDGETSCRDIEWEAYLNATGWDKDCVLAAVLKHAPEAERQGKEHGPHKLSFYLRSVESVEKLCAGLESEGLGMDKVSVIHSGGRFLDVVPALAGKGKALRYVLEKLARERGVTYAEIAARTLCCGDSGNDCAMMEVEGVHGCIVGNADDDMLAWLHSQDSEIRKRIIHYAGKRGPFAIAAAMLHLQFAGC